MNSPIQDWWQRKMHKSRHKNYAEKSKKNFIIVVTSALKSKNPHTKLHSNAAKNLALETEIDFQNENLDIQRTILHGLGSSAETRAPKT